MIFLRSGGLITTLVASVIIIMLKGLPALFFFSLVETAFDFKKPNCL